MGDDPTLLGGAAVLVFLGVVTVGHWLWIAPPAEPPRLPDPPEPRQRLRERLAQIEEEPPVYRARYVVSDGAFGARHAGLPPPAATPPQTRPAHRTRITTFGPQGGMRAAALAGTRVP